MGDFSKNSKQVMSKPKLKKLSEFFVMNEEDKIKYDELNIYCSTFEVARNIACELDELNPRSEIKPIKF